MFVSSSLVRLFSWSLLAAAALADDSSSNNGTDDGDTTSSSSTYGLRIGSVFIVLVAGAVGVSLPVVIGTSSLFIRWLFKILTACGGGVILGTAFIHMLPEASEKLSEAFAPREYPYCELIVLCTVLFISMLESELRKVFGHEHSHDLGDNHAQELVAIHHAVSVSGTPYQSHNTSPDAIPTPTDDSIAEKPPTKGDAAVAHIMEIGIAIHSVIIGIALGALKSYDEVRTLLIAITFHQALEGFALGATIFNSGIRHRVHQLLLCTVFAITTPIGIAIGIGISKSYDQESTRTLFTEGALDAISCGVLIHMGLVNIISELFKNESPAALRMLMYVAYLFGAGGMAVIGIWA